MKHPEERAQGIGERRRAERRETKGRVAVRIDTTRLEGTADNLSKTGILFFTDGELSVTVRIEDGGESREYRGQLVRCERIQGGRRGWAVEFDDVG